MTKLHSISPELLRSCIHGSRASWSALYQNCSPYVFSIVKNYFSEENDQRDVMQEVFANVFSSLSNYDFVKGPFNNWLSKLTVNQCATYLKKTRKINFMYIADFTEVELEDDLHEIHGLRTDELEILLKKMPVGYKTIFLLYVIDEYSHQEISNLLGISQETSRSQLSRSIQWIKKNIFTSPKIEHYGLY